MRCPCCDTEIAAPPDVSALREVRYGSQAYQLVLVLIAVYPRSVSLSDLVAEVYGRREPEWPEDSLRSLISYTRRKIKPYGWSISASRGASVGTYKLTSVVSK